MGRPTKATVDYFAHQVHHGKTMFVLESKYGNDGYALWFKLLEFLGATEGHALDFRDTDTWEYFQAAARVDEPRCLSILNTLSTLKAIDPKLWSEHRVIWVQKFVDGLRDLYRKRKVNIPEKPCFQVPETKIPTPETQQGEVTTAENPHSKVKYSKLKKDSSPNSAEFRLADLLQKLILQNNPEFKSKAVEKWAVHIEKKIRIDKRDPKRIEAVIRWCQADSFWAANILSTEALRKQYDKLWIKMQNGKPPAPPEKPQPAREPLPQKCSKCQKPSFEVGTLDVTSGLCRACYGATAPPPGFDIGGILGAIPPGDRAPSARKAQLLQQAEALKKGVV